MKKVRILLSAAAFCLAIVATFATARPAFETVQPVIKPTGICQDVDIECDLIGGPVCETTDGDTVYDRLDSSPSQCPNELHFPEGK